MGLTPKVIGFSILRNGVKFDYPFMESLRSLAMAAEKVYVACGQSEDESEDLLRTLDFVETVPTIWDENLRKGGLILSQQTNLVFNLLRKNTADENAWGFYLQADEVLHEQDILKIKNDIAEAEVSGCDAIRFRYFHFWQSHHQIAINKKWYPQEIRAVRLKSPVERWGDAQSFRHQRKIYDSDAFIYHYGHVREQSSYVQKKLGFFRLYSGEQELSSYMKRMEKKDSKTETLSFWGSHPEVMKGRIQRLGELFAAPIRDEVEVYGNPQDYRPSFLRSIRAKKVEWKEPNWWRNFFVKDVPVKMRSPLAHPWTAETRLMLQLSRRQIGVSSESSENR